MQGDGDRTGRRRRVVRRGDGGEGVLRSQLRPPRSGGDEAVERVGLHGERRHVGAKVAGPRIDERLLAVSQFEEQVVTR
jgi:hypothetical protein